MATIASRIERITKDVLASRQLTAECSAILNPLTVVTLEDWAKGRYSKIRFRIVSSSGDDDYDERQITDGIGHRKTRLPLPAGRHKVYGSPLR
jgi:hypothetical protein